MPNLQRRLAASILKVGQSKVWMDPEKVKDIEQAITRSDVRKLILKKFVKRLPDKVKMPVGMKKKKAGERGEGRRKGTKNSIVNRKTRWVQTVRPLRRELAAIKKGGMIENATYNQMRKLIKGGVFRNKSHLRLYLEQHGLLKKK
ncbi:MAG: 50S ribosomal protein L19e [Candidatus Aenigmarchaeota archaeon]|nr:50S ribosomal protein L19e [Candidatus Aenigmarchaeota archaeon]